PDSDRHQPAVRHRARRRRVDRDDLFLAGHRPSADHLDPGTGLPDGRGYRAGVRGHVHPRQPGHRSPVHGDRSTREAVSMNPPDESRQPQASVAAGNGGGMGMAHDAGAPIRSAGLVRRFANNKAAVVGLVILGVFVFLAVAAPLLTGYDPTNQDLSQAFLPPSWQHWLGTDNLGRDVFARIMYGGRYTLMIGVIAVGIATLIGVPIGLASGYYGGATDMVIQRGADILLSFNPFLLALILVAA